MSEKTPHRRPATFKLDDPGVILMYGPLDVFSEHDLNKSDEFRKKATSHVLRDLRMPRGLVMTADRLHQVPHRNHNKVALGHTAESLKSGFLPLCGPRLSA